MSEAAERVANTVGVQTRAAGSGLVAPASLLGVYLLFLINDRTAARRR